MCGDWHPDYRVDYLMSTLSLAARIQTKVLGVEISLQMVEEVTVRDTEKKKSDSRLVVTLITSLLA